MRIRTQSNAKVCRPRRGMAAVLMVVMLMLLTVIVIGTVLGQGRDQDLTVRRVQTEQAFYAAEGGFNMAIREFMEGVDEDGDGNAGTISDDGNAANNPTIGGAKVYATYTIGNNQMTLHIHASHGNSGRTIEVTIEK